MFLLSKLCRIVSSIATFNYNLARFLCDFLLPLILMIIRKPKKGNGVVILDGKLYDNAIEEIISDNSKFGEVDEDLTLRREASLKRFLHKVKQINFF